MPPPLPPEVRNAIIEDLREGRLSQKEIAATRLGSEKAKGTVSRIAKQAGITPARTRGQSIRSSKPKVSSPKPETIAKIKLETFGPEERLLLIDQAISELKAVLSQSRYPAGMMQWTAALERLLEQRRKETGAGGDKTDSDGFFEALEAVSPGVWAGINASDYTLPMGSIQPEAMAIDDLVDEGEPDQEP